jgi:RNA polymerase sigma factor (sigma-70 family)
VHYVAIVAGNLTKDRLRCLPRPAAPIEEVPEIADPDDPEQTLETRQLAECLDRARERLSDTYRRIIHLRHDLGLSHREIADNLDKTMGYVAGTLARAERYLREELWETCRDHLEKFGAIFGRNE